MNHMGKPFENPIISIINSINNKCRCCLEEGKHLHNISEKYIEIFRNSLNFSLSNDSRLPKLICDGCVNYLMAWEKFRDMVIATERQLLEALEWSSKSVLKAELCVKEEASDIETEGEDFGDDDSMFQPSDVPSSDDAEAEPEVKSGNEDRNLSITINSAVMTRQACRASNETTIAPTSASKRNVLADEAKLLRKKMKHNSSQRSVESCDMSDYESDTPLADVNDKLSQVLKKSDQKRSDDRFNVTNMRNNFEPKIPKFIKIDAKAIMSQSKLSIDSNHTKNRENIILTLKHSTIVPFRHDPLRKYDYKCFYCDNFYETMKELGTHTESQHVGKVTDKYILSLLRKRAHTHINTDVKCIKCRLCGEQLKTLESLKEHLTDTHKKIYHDMGTKPSVLGYDFSTGKPKCTFCDKAFDHFVMISSHINQHYDGYVCYVCGKNFITQSKLTSHLRIHKNKKVKTHICERCGFSYKSIEELNNHVETMHLNGELKCKLCPKTFPTRQYRMRTDHMIEAHKSHLKSYTCDICQNGKVYHVKHSLNTHKNRVHGERKVSVTRLQCGICEFGTIHRNSMKEHMDVHNGIKNYECELCKKRFGKKTTLTIHMRYHANDKRFVCTVCDARFVQKNALNYHIKSKHSK